MFIQNKEYGNQCIIFKMHFVILIIIQFELFVLKTIIQKIYVIKFINIKYTKTNKLFTNKYSRF